jgi:hypothetical protein
MKSTALYYPFILPPSKAELMNAMLYWDSLQTLVPDGFDYDYYCPNWARPAVDYGFLKARNICHKSDEVQAASEEFMSDLDRPATVRNTEYLQRYTKAGDYRIHSEKMNLILQSRLFSGQNTDREGFYKTSELLFSYMSKLTSIVSEKDGTVPYTNVETSHEVIIDRFSESPQVYDLESILISLSMSTISIPATTSFAQLLDFRETHTAELKNYRKAIHNISISISGLGYNDQFRELKKIEKEQFIPASEELKAKMSESGFDFGSSILQLAATTAVGVSLGGSQAGLATGLISAAFSAFRWRKSQNKVRKEPLSYLARLQEQFPQN